MPLRRFLALPSTWSLLTLVSVLALVPAASCGEGTGPAPELDFSAFDTALEAFLLENELEGANVVIVHRDWGVVHQRAFGSFTLDRISLLASASKILSVGVIMRLHDEGVLLNLETGEYFGLDGVGMEMWKVLRANQK